MEPNDFSLLREACEEGNVSAIKKYVNSSNINTRDNQVTPKQEGNTLLMHSILNSQGASVKLLLSKGADPNIPNKQKKSPLHMAAEQCSHSIISQLLSYGGNPSANDVEGNTPLHISVFQADAIGCKMLLKAGSSPNAVNQSSQRTALHYAAEKEDVECSKVLLKYKASLSMRDKDGISPEDLAPVSFFKQITDDSVYTQVEKNSLYVFLAGIRLEEYYNSLVKAGFDDLNAMISQMETPIPIDVGLLQSIGVSKPGHAKRLLMKLEEPMNIPMPVELNCCGNPKGISEFSLNNLETSLYDWLKELKLEHLQGAFIDAGYDDIDLIRDHMKSLYPITESVLRDEMQITKPGHILRILGKLHAEVRRPMRFEVQTETSSCNNCLVF